jgi:hypothetical protein
MTMTAELITTGAWIAAHDTLPVVSWESGGDGEGFDPRSAYVETYWLAVLGPSSILTLRRLTDWLEDTPSGVVISLEELALSLGLGHGTGRNAPVVRTLDRLVGFGVARIAWEAYAVRTAIPALSQRQVRRLPRSLAARHGHDVDGLRSAPTVAPVVGIGMTPDLARRRLGKPTPGHNRPQATHLNRAVPDQLRSSAHLNEGPRPR